MLFNITLHITRSINACYPAWQRMLPSTLLHGEVSSAWIPHILSGFCSEASHVCHLNVVSHSRLFIADPVHWEVIAKEPFVEGSRSPPLWRALYIPVLSAQHVHWTHYILLSSKTLVDRQKNINTEGVKSAWQEPIINALYICIRHVYIKTCTCTVFMQRHVHVHVQCEPYIEEC